jgi:Glycosyltransferase family 87
MIERLKRLSLWNAAALAAWTAAFLGVLIHRTGLFSHKEQLARTTLDVYRLAGEHWIHAQYLYDDRRGFVYSPLVAALFAPLARLPLRAGAVLWVTINFAVLLGGVAAVLRAGIIPNINTRRWGAVYLLLLPLALGNLDVLQANPLVIGLLLLAFAAVQGERWSLAAGGVALATYFKIYPIAAGLLIVVIAPRRFGWRLLLALALPGLLTFACQHWDYVRDQYHFWIATRTADNRFHYSEKDAPVDLWLLLVRVGGLPIPAPLYRGFQVLSGGAIALFNLAGLWKGWPRRRILAGSLCFVSIWMTLLGPASEAYTYILLAPAAALALVQAFSEHRPIWLRSIIVCALALLILAVARSSFLSHTRAPWAMAVQPLGAIFFLGYGLFWLLDGNYWTGGSAITGPSEAKA